MTAAREDRIQKVAEIIDGEAWWRCPQEPDTCASCLERREIANTKAASIEALYSEEIERLRGALKDYRRIHQSVAVDLLLAHHGRGNGNSQWMTEDDRELRNDFRAAGDRALQALSGGGGGDNNSSVAGAEVAASTGVKSESGEAIDGR